MTWTDSSTCQPHEILALALLPQLVCSNFAGAKQKAVLERHSRLDLRYRMFSHFSQISERVGGLFAPSDDENALKSIYAPTPFAA